MEKILKKGVSIILIYSLLIVFTLYMTNRIERLNTYEKADNNIAINLIK